MPKKVKPKYRLKKLFEKQKCYTIEELHQSLDYSIISIRRFLKEIGYYSSFTHNSKWYTLHNIPSFDKNGLWFFKDIGFSKHGNQSLTILHFINNSTKGLSARVHSHSVSDFQFGYKNKPL